MKILLTGGTGFLGSRLLDCLLSKGHNVVVIKRSTSNLARIKKNLAKCKCYNLDEIIISKIFELEKIDVVIHCATAYGRGSNSVSFEEVVKSNLNFPLEIMETAIHFQCKCFINTDTFFTKQLPERLNLSQPLYMPAYTLSKYQFREWGRLWAQEGKIHFVNLQMEHIYGPNDKNDKFIPFLIQSMTSGIPKLDLTDGIQVRDFIYVDDVVTAYLTILEHLEELSGYCSFDVGTGQPHTIRELAETVSSVILTRTELNFGGLQRNRTEIMMSVAHTQALSQLGWQCKTPLRDGILQTIEAISGDKRGMTLMQQD